MLEKAVFDSKLADATGFTLQEKLDIQNFKARHPYCALLQMLDLLSDKAANIYDWEPRFLHCVSLHLPAPQTLAAKLASVRPTDISTPADLQLKKQIEAAKNACCADTEEDDDTIDILNEINAFQDISLKTAPRSVLLERLRDNGMGTAAPTPVTPEEVTQLGKQSLQANEGIETETLALILEKQGKLEKAVSVYDHLRAKQPDKAAEYTERIATLNKKIEENTNKK